MYLSTLGLVGSFSSIISFMKMNKHILMLLISLEALMLSLLVFYLGFFILHSSMFKFFLALLTLAACEAALGLSMLVSVLRVRGNDLVLSFNSLNFYA